MTFNNGTNAPDWVAKVIFGATFAAILLIFLGIRTESGLPVLISVVIIVAIIIISVIATKDTSGGKKTSSPDVRSYGKYLPLLADERTKQHPEVQRLLQYTEVQMVFFDSSSLAKAEVANSEPVRELFLVLDEMLAQGAINGNVYGDLQTPPQNSAMLTEKTQIENRDKEKKKPRRTVGKVLMILGITIFVLPFIFAFLPVVSSGGISVTQTASFVLLFNMAPFGMLMVIVGMIFRRR